MSHNLISSFMFVLLLSASLIGQNITATINRTVRDGSAAILPGVDITATHNETNESRRFTSDENGNYRAPLLPPGQYTVTAELPGFRTEARTGLILQVGQIARVELTMKVGNVADKIEVTADASLNGREFQQLVILVPGGPPSVQGSSNQFRGGISLAGQRDGHEAGYQHAGSAPQSTKSQEEVCVLRFGLQG